jgi:D-glycero-D-manno-heptose 1,7-bisphosphate phosphatase
MSRPAIFFDRDNTLIECDGYLGDPAKVRLIPGAAGAVARARELGFVVVTFSNQSGVARGMFSEEAVTAVNNKLGELLEREDPEAKIDRHEFCPFHPEAKVEKYRQESDLRKPRPGMIHRAAEALDLDLAASWVIGDAPRDIEAGQAAGCHTILIKNSGLPASPAALERSSAEPDETVSDLAEAMELIEAFAGAQSLHRRSGVPSASFQARELVKLEHLAQQILDQVRRRNEQAPEFSLGKMLAGITQILAIAVAVGSYFYKPVGEPLMPMLVAIFLQAMTVALLLMGRER